MGRLKVWQCPQGVNSAACEHLTVAKSMLKCTACAYYNTCGGPEELVQDADDRVRAALNALTGTGLQRNRGADIYKKYSAEIIAARERGVPWYEISEALGEQGIVISKGYLCRLFKGKGSKV